MTPICARKEDDKLERKEMNTMNMRPLKRAIHIDFHTMPGIYDFNRDWDAGAFARRLADAHVKYINTFAKCNTGFCYYPSKIGPVYPGMKGDMFGDLLRECHKRDIGVTAYFNIAIDHEACRIHREWSKVIKEEAGEDKSRYVLSVLQDKNTWTGPWNTRLTCYNTGFGDYFKAMLKEFISMYPEVDGVFFDCINTTPCYCNDCLEEIRAQGGDPTDPETVQRHTLESNRRFCLELKEIAGEDKYMLCNSQPYWRTRDYNTHIEIECLQNGGWSYEFFAPQAAHARMIKKDVLYMNGRFHKSWGDFGGLKSKAALENDMWDAISNGIGCSIGDHMHPAEILDEKVYGLVGEIYEEIEKLEPWTEEAVYQADIGVVIPLEEEDFIFDGPYAGICRMLGELKYTFNIVNETMDFGPYKLLILPDRVRLGETLEAKVREYLEAGGKVLTSGESGLAADGYAKAGKVDRFALEQYWPLHCTGKMEHAKAYYQLAGECAEGADSFRYAMYAPTVLTDVPEGAQVLAWQVAPYFEKNWDGFHAYAYNPPMKANGAPAALHMGQVCHISFQVFEAYSRYVYPAHKALVDSCIRRLMPQPSFVCQGIPSTARVTLTAKGQQRMLHVKVTYPELRSKFGIIEEHNCLPAGAKITLQGEYAGVYAAPGKEPLEFAAKDGNTVITLPEICGYLMVVGGGSLRNLLDK